MKKDDTYNPSMLTRFSCASSAAIVAESITFWLDSMITRLQLQKGYQQGFVSMLRTVSREEGFLSLFRGLTPAVSRQIVTGGIGVGWYPVLRKKFCGENQEPRLYQRVAAGSLSGMCAQFVASPLDVVKVRLQAEAKLVSTGQTPTYRGMFHAFELIWKNEGVAGYFRGVTPSLLRAGAQYGAGTATYDQTKSLLLGTFAFPDIAPTHFLCSGISGFATACVGCPADVIKTRMIAQILHGGERKYKHTLDCIVKTVRSEGLRGMYKGFVPTYLRLAPWQIIFFVTFEQVSLAVTGHTFKTK